MHEAITSSTVKIVDTEDLGQTFAGGTRELTITLGGCSIVLFRSNVLGNIIIVESSGDKSAVISPFASLEKFV